MARDKLPTSDANWSYGRRRALGFAALFTGPALWWATVLLAPYALMFAISFYSKQFPFMIPDFQFGNYIKLFSENQYYTVLLRSLKVAFLVSCFALLLAYPLSYFLVFIVRSPRFRLFLYVATIIPLWVSYLLRAYTWKTILGTEGILNSFLILVGLTEEPVQLFLYNQFAMIVTMTYIYIPFMVMPLYASLEKIPRSLIEASKDCGVGNLETFFRITLPLTVPGILVGSTFTFCLSTGDFIAPQLVGGPYSNMVANVVATQFGIANNWPLGSAYGMILLFIVLGIVTLSDKLERTGRLDLG